MTTADYRPEIDGIRAIAVLAVVLYHAGVPGLEGGYAGVDAFFVVSGYLIVGLIKRDLEAGRFSIAAFYARRIRRILPALAAVVATTFTLAWVLLLPYDLRFLSNSVLYTGLASPNILFWRWGMDYFRSADLHPLLHLWSLGVEEHLYFVVPPLLLLLHRLGPHLMLTGLGIGAALSATAALFMSQTSPEAAFFLMPTRAWQFLVGGLLAVREPRIGEAFKTALCYAGVAALGGAGFSARIPGLAPLLATCGTAAVLAAGRQEGLPYRLLASSPARFLGKISYSLYLWHWPILLLVPVAFAQSLGPLGRAALVGASVVAAALTWRWVEEPFRRGPWILSDRAAYAFAGVVAAAFIAIGASFRSDGAPNRFDPALLEFIGPREMDIGPCSGFSEERMLSGEFCRVGVGVTKQAVLVWGDSHTRNVMPAFETAAASLGQPVDQVRLPGCPPMAGETVSRVRPFMGKRCSDLNNVVVKSIAERRYSAVVLVGRWSLYAGQDPSALESGLTASVEAARRAGSTVWIVEEVPTFEFDPRYIAVRMSRRGLQDWVPTLPRSRPPGPAKAILERIVASGSAQQFETASSLCGHDACTSEIDGRLAYWDTNHLTNRAAQIFSQSAEKLITESQGAQPHAR